MCNEDVKTYLKNNIKDLKDQKLDLMNHIQELEEEKEQLNSRINVSLQSLYAVSGALEFAEEFYEQLIDETQDAGKSEKKDDFKQVRY